MKTQRPEKRTTPYGLAALLAVSTAVLYWRVIGCQFLTVYDDGSYVVNNAYVLNGLSRAGIKWAFGFHVYNWHPLTWISHMLDISLFGLNPGGHHAVNMILHALSAVVLFLALDRITKSAWKSLFVAALFAVHPAHVESVAWVAERKDVLSGLFWMLTMLAYACYAEQPTNRRFIVVCVALALGLMAKPMLVTLPFVLLLLDYWPLKRLATTTNHNKDNKPSTFWNLLIEKSPMLTLSIWSSIMTYFAQKSGGAMSSLDEFPFTVRIANALVAYCAYIGKMFWPTKLSILYPHPGTSLPVWAAPLAALVLMAITALVIILRKRYPYLLVGWLWYVITLVPVIGLIQVGKQAMANRYTYIPFIGLFIALAWLVPDLLAKVRKSSSVLKVVAAAIVLACAVGTWIQIGYWKDDVALFSYAVRSTKNNTIALGNLGWAYGTQNDWETAAKYFKAAINTESGLYDMHYGLGISYRIAGKYAEAEKEQTIALRLKPDLEPAQKELDAMVAFREANEKYNAAVKAYSNGKPDEAETNLREAISIRPNFPEAYCNLGVILGSKGDYNGAIEQYANAIKYRPSMTIAYNNLAVIYINQSKYADAWAIVHAAQTNGCTLNPDLVNTLRQKMPEPIN